MWNGRCNMTDTQRISYLANKIIHSKQNIDDHYLISISEIVKALPECDVNDEYGALMGYILDHKEAFKLFNIKVVSGNVRYRNSIVFKISR